MSDKELYYRHDPNNQPTDLEGDALGGGPWLNMGEADPQMEGQFGGNNGRIAIVAQKVGQKDGKAHLFVAPDTSLNVKILAKAQFRNKGIFVPYSNGESSRTAQHNKARHEWRQLSEVIGRPGALFGQMCDVTEVAFTTEHTQGLQKVELNTNTYQLVHLLLLKQGFWQQLIWKDIHILVRIVNLYVRN